MKKTIQKPKIKSILKTEPKKIDKLAVNQQGEIKKVSKQDPEYFDPKTLKFQFNLADTDYQLDRLQNKFLQFYLRADSKFRRAFSSNFTNEFLGYIRDKTALKEPLKLSIMGAVRTGKSYIAISLCVYHQACYEKKFTIDYICANENEYLEKLRTFPTDKLFNRIFLIDESKITMYGIGSIARKNKMLDVSNIIAKNNISSVFLCPTKFVDTSASYGIRTFGRCFKTKTVRAMLYNLQESAKLIPTGNIYLPIFTSFLPKDYAENLEKQYIAKKDKWIEGERDSTGGDILATMRRKTAEHFMKDSQYLSLKTHDSKVSYLGVSLGSEYTSKELEDIFQITKLLQQGIKFK